jgi:hypothetical protein
MRATSWSSLRRCAKRGEREEINAMRTALVQLLSDFLSAIVFLITYGGTDNLYLATGAAITTSLAQFAVAKIRRQPVDAIVRRKLRGAAAGGPAVL